MGCPATPQRPSCGGARPEGRGNSPAPRTRVPVARPAPEHGPHMRSSAKLPTLGPTPSALISVCGTHHETMSATRYPSTGLLPAGAARAPPWGAPQRPAHYSHLKGQVGSGGRHCMSQDDRVPEGGCDLSPSPACAALTPTPAPALPSLSPRWGLQCHHLPSRPSLPVPLTVLCTVKLGRDREGEQWWSH